MSQESDLLYEVLALQMNFITKDQMVECGALWASCCRLATRRITIHS